jgi:Adenylate and Guanylate cyclase catalytic domain
VQKVRLAVACEQAGLPMAGIAAAIRAGRLSFAFLEAAPFRRWAVRSTRTYRQVSQVSQETGVPLDTLGAVLESMGFARAGPDEPMREDELEVVPLLQLGLSSGTFDLAWLTRLGRAHADGLRLLATAWTEAYQARFEGPALESGADQRTAMELGGDFLPLGGPALPGIYRTEQQGDATAAALAETLAVLVNRSSREHGGVPPAHVGVAAGPVAAQGGDYFGRTVNLAARIAAHAGPGQVLVSQRVAESAPPAGVVFSEAGEVELKGFAHPVRLLEACRA